MCAFTCPVAIYELVNDKSYLVAENLSKMPFADLYELPESLLDKRH